MFAVIYSFKMKPGKKDSFLKAWGDMTLLIREYEGGLGSRLHQNSEHEYIAYAQWPSEETWKNSGDKLPESASEIRKQMRNSCEEIKTLYQMELVEDLLI